MHVRGMSHFVQEYGGHGEEQQSSFARGSFSSALYHDLVEVNLDPNRGRTALLTLLRVARYSFPQRASGEVLDRDSEMHASG